MVMTGTPAACAGYFYIDNYGTNSPALCPSHDLEGGRKNSDEFIHKPSARHRAVNTHSVPFILNFNLKFESLDFTPKTDFSEDSDLIVISVLRSPHYAASRAKCKCHCQSSGEGAYTGL